MKKIEIYSTPTCHYCHDAKEFLTSHGIEFIDYNVLENPEKRQELISKSKQMGVPFIVVTNEDGSEDTMVGFSEEKLAAAVGV
jgi:glutaredoxin-like YruB-family protein